MGHNFHQENRLPNVSPYGRTPLSSVVLIWDTTLIYYTLSETRMKHMGHNFHQENRLPNFSPYWRTPLSSFVLKGTPLSSTILCRRDQDETYSVRDQDERHMGHNFHQENRLPNVSPYGRTPLSSVVLMWDTTLIYYTLAESLPQRLE